MCLASALGFPASLLSASSDGTASREGFRRWLHSFVLPVAELVAEEATGKLETECRFDFNRLEAADVAGRARAFGQLRKGGLRAIKAVEVAGIHGVTAADIEADDAAGTPAQAAGF